MSGSEKSFAELVATLRADAGSSPVASRSPARESSLPELLAQPFATGAVPLPAAAKAFDTDGNGVLDGAEVATMLQAMSGQPDASKQQHRAATVVPPSSPQVATPQPPPDSPSAIDRGGHTTKPASPSDEFVHGLLERAAGHQARESLEQLEQRIRTSSVVGPSVPSPVTRVQSSSGPAAAVAALPADHQGTPEGAVAETRTQCESRCATPC